MTDASSFVRVNRAPVLTLWAAVVAERQGHPPATALSLASAVAATAERAKAHRLGLAEERAPTGPSASSPRTTARLLGREVRLTQDADGVVLADAGDAGPAQAAPVAAYLTRSFGKRLGEVRAAMEDLAGRYTPDALNRNGFRLYEQFRPEVPPDVTGWGAKGELDLQKIRRAGG
ncbi:hypothetical protein [Falsiroseomonas sp. E2-1-a20]|uniref:hypothetical protein n=1 Tax=Falsiroseomonas sp. E2-1-a20 TaxID=3239300 RepID=UPI003F388E93